MRDMLTDNANTSDHSCYLSTQKAKANQSWRWAEQPNQIIYSSTSKETYHFALVIWQQQRNTEHTHYQ